MSDVINNDTTVENENGAVDTADLPTSGTVQTETKPEDKPRTVIAGSFFKRFELPRISESWSENKGFGTEMYKVYTVEDGTFFDESVVIDEYAEFLKKDTEETNNG